MNMTEILSDLKSGKINPEYAQLLLEDDQISKKNNESVLSFNFDEPYVRDHTVHGERILLGVTYIAIAIKLLKKNNFNLKNTLLKNIIFKKPVVFNKGENVEIYPEFVYSNKKINIYSLIDNNKEEIASIDIENIANFNELKSIDFNLIESQTIEKINSDLIYSLDNELGIKHGESLKTIDTLNIINNKECFLKLSLKEGNKDKGWTINPAFIEAASMCWIHLISKENRKSFIPLSVKSIQVIKNLNSIAYSHVTLVKMRNDLAELDIDIYDEYEVLAVKIKGFVLKHFGKNEERIEKNTTIENNIEKNEIAKDTINEEVKGELNNQDISNLIKDYIVKKIKQIDDLSKIKINANKNFMEIGLNSIQLLNLAKEIECEINIELYPTLFFEYQNIKELTVYFKETYEEDFIKYFNKNNNEKKNRTNNNEKNKILDNLQQEQDFKERTTRESDIEEDDDIAIIGMNGILPESNNLNEFWNNLINKKDMIKEIPLDHFDYKGWYDTRKQTPDKMYCKHGSFIDDVAKFDAKFFGVSQSEAEVMDPQLRKLLEVTYATLEDAGYIEKVRGSNTGYYVGTCFHDYLYEILKSGKRVGPYDGTGNATTMLANYPSFCFDLNGPSLSVDTACSSSLVALHLACNAIKNKECEMAVAAGVNLVLSPWHYLYFCSTGVLSQSGRCHTFDSQADGYVPGEAVVAVLLKPLKKAKQDNDQIHAVIKASAINHGGHASAVTAPNVKKEAEVIYDAWKKSGIDPNRIDLIEAHGTGTQLGDPIEVNAIKSAFNKLNRGSNKCFINSIKGSLGHTEGAAGLVGILRVILAMKHKTIPAMPKFEKLNPIIDIKNTPLTINTESTEWKQHGDLPRAAGISSFGIGGSYAHVVLEEYIESESQYTQNEVSEIITLSAKTKSSLFKKVESLYEYLSENRNDDKLNLGNIGYTLNKCREDHDERIAIVANNINDLIFKLSEILLKKTGANKIWINSVQDMDDEIIVKNESLDIMANLWTSGYMIDWEKYYYGKDYRVVSLPTYSFDGKDYWVKELKPVANNLEKNVSCNFILEEIIEINGKSEFTINLQGNEFYLNEHIVHGKNVLVGAALIEASTEAVNRLWPNKKIKFRNIQWFQTVVVEGREKTLSLIIDKSKNSIEIKSNLDNENIIYFRADFSLDFKQEVISQLPNKSELKTKCTNKILKDQLYSNFENLGLMLGDTFRVVNEVYYNDEIAFSNIKSSVNLNNHSYILHPALLDGTFHGISAFFMDEKEAINIPFSIGEMQIYNRLQGEMTVYLEYSKDHVKNKTNNKFSIFNIIICNKDNNILAVIRNFAARKILPEKLQGNEENKEVFKETKNTLTKNNLNETYFLNCYWKESKPLDLKQHNWNGGVIAFVEEYNFAEKLFNTIGIENNLRIIVTKGNSFKKINDNYYEINPTSSEDYMTLWKTIGDKLFYVESIIHYWSQSIFDVDKNVLTAQFNNGPLSYFFICQALSSVRLKNKINIYYLYSYGEVLVEPINEALTSMSKSISKENLKLQIKSIGFKYNTSFDEVYHIIKNEYEEKDTEVLYKDNKRFIKAFKAIDTENLNNNEKTLDEGSVVIITGGFGAIGLIIANYLVKAYKAKVVLTGRRKNLNKEEYKKLFRELGGDCLCLSGNICNEEDVKNIISTTKAHFGKVNGIIHCAGITKDRSFIFKNLEDIKDVLSPKVYGTVLLDLATKNENLDFFVTISSISAIIGNIGQSDYAYANSFMDSFSAWRNSLKNKGYRTGKSLSINYPLWKDGGMTLDEKIVQKYIDELGIVPISNKTGLMALECGLKNNINKLCVVEGDSNKIDAYLNNVDWNYKKSHSKLENNNKGKNIMNVNVVKDELIQLLSRLVQINLDIQDDTRIEECQMDSIGYVEFANQINEKFDINISPAIFFANPSIIGLAANLKEEYPEKFNSTEEEYYTDPIFNIDFESATNDIKFEDSIAYKQDNSFNKEVINKNNDIAIIGMDGMFPNSPNLESLWNNLKEGNDLITEVPKERWDWKEYCEKYDLDANETALKWGGFIQDVDKFDNKFFNITPREAEQMDPQQRLFMMMVWRAIEDSGYSPSNFSGKNVGVFAGVSSYDYMDLMRMNGTDVEAYTSMGNAHSMIANRISYQFNLHGPSESIDTACSSSLVAVSRAFELLKNDECEYAIAGGINLMLSPTLHQSFNKAGMLSSDGRCKTFDKDANGYVRGEGGGVIIMKRLDKAIEDNDNIYAVIKGCAINHGGRATTITAPNPDAQAELLVSCYEKANINFSTIKYIETHGTGTELGDAIEIEGLKKAQRILSTKQNTTPSKDSKCIIGSVKTNMGHLEAAAGIASLIKSILILKNGQIPPHINVKEINPKLKLQDSNFTIATNLIDLEYKKSSLENQKLNRIGVSSFGFGGTNAHIILEDYKEKNHNKYKSNNFKSNIYTFSAKSEESLQEYMKSFNRFLDNNGNSYTTEEIQYNLNCVRSSMNVRLAIVVNSISELRNKIEQVISNGIYVNAKGIYSGENSKKDELVSLLSGDAGSEFVKYLLKSGEMDKLASIWALGINVNWKEIYGEKLIKHISLPKYEFKKYRHWIEIKKKNSNLAKSESKEYKKSETINVIKSETNNEIIDEPNKEEIIVEIQNNLRKWILAITKVEAEELNNETIFSSIGLDSILSMELLKNIRNKYDVRLFPNELLINPTISKMAILIKESLPKKLENIEYKNNENKNITTKTKYKPNNRNILKNNKDKRVVYILSSPRSGSTLLRTMLMGNSEIFAPSELMLLPYDDMEEWDENLNERNWVHFKDGLIETIKVLKNVSPDDAIEEVKQMVSEKRSIKDVYRLLQKLSNEKYFIDKTPPYSESVDILKKAESTTPNALYIFLHRHPLSVMESLVRNRFNKLLGSTEEPWNFADTAWRQANKNIVDFIKTIPSERKFNIAYEELVNDPKAMMSEVCNWLEINYEDSMINPYEGNKMIKGLRSNSMSVGDPNFLNHTSIESELANSWKKHLKFKNMLSDKTLNLAEHLGYSFEESNEESKSFKLGPSQKAFLKYIYEFDKNLQFTMVQSINLSFKEKLDYNNLIQVLKDIIEAHPILTNKFLNDGDVWYQEPSECNIEPIKLIDGSLFSQKELEEIKQEEIKRMAEAISIKDGKLIELAVIDCGNFKYEFILLIHHFVCDAVSAGVLWKEIFDRYNKKFTNSKFIDLGFKEYVNSIDEIMNTDSYKNAETYWNSEISQNSTKKLPIDFEESENANIEANQRQIIKNVNFSDLGSKPKDVNMFYILSTALYLTISELTDAKDVCIAHMLQQRSLPINKDFSTSVGFFVEDVPVFVNIDCNKGYADIINDFKIKFSSASTIATSYEILANEGKLPKVHDISDVRLNYQPYKGNFFDSNSWESYLYLSPNLKHKYNFNCIVQELENGIRFVIRYSVNIYKKESADSFVQKWISNINDIYSSLN